MNGVVALVRTGRALQLAQGLGLGRVIGVNIEEQPSLQARVRAAGGDCPIVSIDDVFTGMVRETDYYGLAQLLGAAARTVGFDLLVCGEGSGCIGPAVAERLSIPYLGSVVHAELRDGKVLARRLEPLGARVYTSSLPAMIGVLGRPPVVAPATNATGAIDDPAQPPTERRLGLGDIGLSSAELRWRRRFAPQKSAIAGPVRHRVPFADVAELARRLVDEGLIPPLRAEALARRAEDASGASG